MKLLVVADGHYYQDLNGNVYVESVFDYDFYKRYLSVFDAVYAIVRMDTSGCIPTQAKLASGEGVIFLPIPPSRGAFQYLKHYWITRKLINNYIRDFDCAIFRAPGVIANTVSSAYLKTLKIFAVEVVVDPWEYFAKGTIRGLGRALIQVTWTLKLKKLCKIACGVSYVTESYLQNKYPCRALLSDDYFTASYSSVELPDDKFGKAREYSLKNKYIISHVANSFSGYGKGHITLMNALKRIIENGYDVDVMFIGDGPLRTEFSKYAEQLRIDSHVHFLGRLSDGGAVRNVIRDSDLFVFPTRAEGLPRVILEAMAEGLPVVSSPVCGIPEILQKECMVSYDDYEGFSKVIMKLLDNPEIMTKYSSENIITAQKYKSSILNEKRKVFYQQLRDKVLLTPRK